MLHLLERAEKNRTMKREMENTENRNKTSKGSHARDGDTNHVRWLLSLQEQQQIRLQKRVKGKKEQETPSSGTEARSSGTHVEHVRGTLANSPRQGERGKPGKCIKELIAEMLPNLMEDTNPQPQEAQQISSRINSKRQGTSSLNFCTSVIKKDSS